MEREIREIFDHLDSFKDVYKFDRSDIDHAIAAFVRANGNWTNPKADAVEAADKHRDERLREAQAQQSVRTIAVASADDASRMDTTRLQKRLSSWVLEMRKGAGIKRLFSSPVDIWESLEIDVPAGFEDQVEFMEKRIYSSNEEDAWQVLLTPGLISLVTPILREMERMARNTGFSLSQLADWIFCDRKPLERPYWWIGRSDSSEILPDGSKLETGSWKITIFKERPTDRDFDAIRQAIPKRRERAMSWQLALLLDVINDLGREPTSNEDWRVLLEMLSRRGKHYANISGPRKLYQRWKQRR